MADRQRFCVTILSLMILGSGCYLGYFTFIDSEKDMIDKYNWMRLCIFFIQHVITLGMLMKILYYEQTDNVVSWMFQLSLLIMLTFIGGQVFTVARGGRIFGSSLFFYPQANNDNQNPVLQFQLNQITLYYQIMTDFVMFFIVSAVALIVMRCKKMEEENKYQFMIDNLKSEDFVDQPNVHDKKTCAICLTDLANQRVLKVPCEHIFHKQCLVNWLKRSTICPLCRTDIEQSLGPNSPLRFPGENSAVSVVPQHRQQPELTFPVRPTVSVGVQSNRGYLTDRFNQQVSLGTSRVSISRAVRERNPLGNRGNQVRDNSSYPQSRYNFSTNSNFNERVQNNNNLLTIRSHRQNYMTRLDIESNHRRQVSPISRQSYTPRSIFLPPPESQNVIQFKGNQSINPISQPLINVYKITKLNKQQVFVPLQQQNMSPQPKLYKNPNENFIQNAMFKQTQEKQRQHLSNDKQRVNEMIRDQLIKS